MKDRQWEQILGPEVTIVARQSSTYPYEYAISLRYRGQTIRLFDNSHAVAEHHEHRYIGDQKQPPTITHGDVNTAFANAIAQLLANWRVYVEEWKGTR